MRDLQALWDDPKHWSIFGYHCREDPRGIVPKRNIGMGWTMNWSSRRAFPLLVAIIAIPVVPLALVVEFNRRGILGALATTLAHLALVPFTIWAIVALCRRESRIRKFE